MNLKLELSKKLKIKGVSQEEIYALLGTPPDAGLGDFCMPCFTIAKAAGKSPADVAAEVCKQAESAEGVSSALVAGGYANFKLDRNQFVAEIIKSVKDPQTIKDLGKVGAGKTLCIDFSSINIAKQPHIGHLSSTAIGAAIARLHELFGYKVIRINYLGDYGTQFGKLVVAYKKWGNKADIEKRGIAALQELYVKVNEECERDEVLLNDCRDAMRAINEREAEVTQIFEWFKELTLKEVMAIYEPLGLTFDDWRGEYFYADKVEAVFSELEQKGVATISEGALVVDLEQYNLGTAIVRQSNGASIYLSRDIAAAEDRASLYKFDKMIYITGTEQILHFKQLFKTMELLGYKWANGLMHAPHGRYSLTTGKISSRTGAVALVKDLFKQSIERAELALSERGTEVDGVLARELGLGALVFGALKRERQKDVVFDMDAALKFEGDTSVYIQYTHARCCSVLEKGKAFNVDNADCSNLNSDDAWDVLKLLSSAPQVYRLAIDTYEPCEVSRFLLNLSTAFNAFYAKERIVTEDAKTTEAKLTLTKLVATTLAEGLKLLGISAPERM